MFATNSRNQKYNNTRNMMALQSLNPLLKMENLSGLREFGNSIIVFCPMQYPLVFWFPLGLPCSQVDPMVARKGDLMLYSDDLFPTEARKLPSCPRSHSVNRKGEAYSSISSSRRSVRFYEASKHNSLALINQEFCRHSLRLHVISYTSCNVSHTSQPPLSS